MLLVPLALSAPGGAPRPGEEVVLAAGAPEVGGTLDAVAADEGAVPTTEPEAADVPQDDAGDPAVTTATPLTTTKPRVTSATTVAPVRSAPASSSKVRARPATSTTTRPKPFAALSVAAVKVAAISVVAPVKPAPAKPEPAKPEPVKPAPANPAPAKPVPAAATPGLPTVWDRLAACESGNTNDAAGPYYGYWQFSAATWQRLGEPGLPHQYSRDRQLAAAIRLQVTSGWGQWPGCARALGLR